MPLHPAARRAAGKARARLTRVLLAGAALLLLTTLVAVAGASAQRPWPAEGEDPNVTPVAGPSWLNQLGLSLRSTNLGRGAGRYGPRGDQTSDPSGVSLAVPRTFLVGGDDLYRLSCQACHREEGTGRPPEIHSVLGPVQASSLALVRRRLQEQHAQSPGTAAQAETTRARAAVLARMHDGGRLMPPRDHLTDADMQVLFAYLTELAGAPDRERQSARKVGWARVGELVVKGTCHICHDAVGPRPSTAAMLEGAIPSLASMLATKPVNEFVQKARAGGVVSLTVPGVFHRGRMPVFYYLRDEEIAAAYVYLATYPPQPARR